MDLLRQVSAGPRPGPPPPGAAAAPRTQLQRTMGVSRAGVKVPTIKIELPASMFAPPGSGAGGPDLGLLQQLAAGGAPARLRPPEVP